MPIVGEPKRKKQQTIQLRIMITMLFEEEDISGWCLSVGLSFCLYVCQRVQIRWNLISLSVMRRFQLMQILMSELQAN